MTDLTMSDTVSSKTVTAPSAGADTVLSISGLNGWYGESHVLHDIHLDVKRGEVVTLLGRNGAGKSTTLKAIMGLLRRRTGQITYEGADLINMPARQIARMGIGYVPEERGIFGSLTVKENLLLPPKVAEGGFGLDEIYELFPNLPERLDSYGKKLSGGEQQMLAIARILRTGAKLLLLDEPTEGLAPVIVQQIGHTIQRLKAAGLTIILVEQNFHFARRLADRHFIIQEGETVDMFHSHEMEANLAKLNAYLGI